MFQSRQSESGLFNTVLANRAFGAVSAVIRNFKATLSNLTGFRK